MKKGRRLKVAGSRRRLTGWCGGGLGHHRSCHGFLACTHREEHPGLLCNDNPTGDHRRCECSCHLPSAA